MKWKTDKAGQKRTMNGFLLFPMNLENETRWLEKATWIELYKWNWSLGRLSWQPITWSKS